MRFTPNSSTTTPPNVPSAGASPRNATGPNATSAASGVDSPPEDLDLEQAMLVSILVLSGFASIVSSTALLLTGQTRPALLVYFRSLRVCDLLSAIFGASKMALVHHARELQVNFFLPDSLFFSSSVAACLALAALHCTMCLQQARPTRFSKVDQRTATSMTVILWNIALTLGFLPLLAYEEDFTLHFFSFYSQPYLLAVGAVQLVLLAACIATAVYSARLAAHTAAAVAADATSGSAYTQVTHDVTPSRGTSDRVTGILREQTVLYDRRNSARGIILTSYMSTADNVSVTASPYIGALAQGPQLPPPSRPSVHQRWASLETAFSTILCLPFLIYLGLTCRGCPLGLWSHRDTAVLYFIPLSLVRALLGSGLHIYLTCRLRRVSKSRRLLRANTTSSYTNPAFIEDRSDPSWQGQPGDGQREH